MEQKFMTILWDTDVDRGQGNPNFQIEYHKNLKDAITHLVKNGAMYEKQEIVKIVDWLPDEEKEDFDIPKLTPKNDEEQIGPPPGTISGPPEQPQVFNNTTRTNQSPNGQPRSIFDGIIPPQFRGPIVKDDD